MSLPFGRIRILNNWRSVSVERNGLNVMNKKMVVLLCAVLAGCAQGKVDILDADKKVIGYCSANFDFHWYGAQDSVNYILYLCAKEYVDQGYTISDESLLAKDYSIPAPPDASGWNKLLAKEWFQAHRITEEKYGYILAALEYQYWLDLDAAAEQLEQDLINQAEYQVLINEAEATFEGSD